MLPMAMAQLFCFGLGYSAQALASRLSLQGLSVSGTVRSADKAGRLSAQGLATSVFDGGELAVEGARALASARLLLASVPPDPAGDPVLRRYGAWLAGRARQFDWVGYLSTTGVYGDRAGGWVDEASALLPSGPRGRRRVEAEAAWLALHAEAGLPVHIFRLAGIYGPGRSAFDALRDGTARRIDKPGQVFSRIHVDDLAGVLAASITRPQPGRIYNVCDDEPASPAEVVAHAAGLLGVPVPPLVSLDEAQLSDMGRSFYADNKRVRNDRMKRELAVSLAYPSYREGLAAILAAGQDRAR